MCNAHNHGGGCDCGWGPPYPTVTVTVTKMYRISSTSSKAAALNVSLPIKKTNYYDLLDDEGKGRVLTTAEKTLQQLADDWFGKGIIKVTPVNIKKGSIEIAILLLVLPAVATHVVFKNHEVLSRKIEQFADYISHRSLKLYRPVRKTYLNEEQRSLRASKATLLGEE